MLSDLKFRICVIKVIWMAKSEMLNHAVTNHPFRYGHGHRETLVALSQNLTYCEVEHLDVLHSVLTRSAAAAMGRVLTRTVKRSHGLDTLYFSAPLLTSSTSKT